MQETTLKHYETLLTSARTFPALAAPSVVVQTGGNMETRHQLDSRSWNVKDSRNVNMGDDNQLTDNSINIGQSFNQRQERIAALDDLIGKIKGAETKNDASEKAEKSLTKVRDELADEAEPNEPMIKKWLENAKNVMVTGALSYEVIEAGKKLWEMFGM